MYTKQLLFGLVCYSMTLSADADSSKPEEECSLENPASFRLSATHREANGIGYNQGYTSFDGFFAFTSIKNWHPFFDVRLHFFNDWKVAANTGFGIRYQPDSVKAIFGINGFFDFRHAHQSAFEQVGGGIEILGTQWEGRANCYFPIINRNNLYETSFIGFNGHQALFSVKRELAFTGFDASVGRTLIRKQSYTLSSILGGYMFFADYDKSAKGGLFKLKSDISRYFSVEVQASYDSLFKGIVQGQAGINLPFGKRIKARKKGLSCRNKAALADRIAEPVDRFEIIVTDHYNIQTPALDPRTDSPLYIVFVNNLSSGGNGTAESPYGTLLAAQNNSAPGEMIYVYEGTSTVLGMASGITLQDRQWLQGSGKSFPAITSYGIDKVPAQTSNLPSITNTSGNTVSLGNGNIVRGFHIIATSNAIAGSNITGFTALDLTCTGASSYDFSFTNVSGAISIRKITSVSDNGIFLSTTNNVALTLQDSSFYNQGSEGLNLTFLGSSNSKATIQYNTFQSSENGSSIASEGTANVSVNFEGNDFTNIESAATAGFELSASGSSTMIAVLKENNYSSPALIGFDFLTADTANSFFYVEDNSSNYSGSSTTAYPFSFEVSNTSTSLLLLQGNIATNGDYLLYNSVDSTFYVQSPNFELSGVESLNTGTFTTAGLGSITYISYTPSSIPNLQ